MLKRSEVDVPYEGDRRTDGGSLLETGRTVLDLVRRHAHLFIIVPLCCGIVAVAYVILTPSIYRAVATMVIDTRRVQQFQQQAPSGEEAVDAATVQTQLEVLKSDNVAATVVKNLRLDQDPEFIGRPGLLARLFGSLGPLALSDDDRLRRAVSIFEANLEVARVAQTYAVLVSFQSPVSDKAARIANAAVDAYITDQLNSKYQATRRASLWLQDRISELRAQASEADKAVVSFKIANNIVDADGRLVNEQQLSEANTQLSQAHAATAEAKARLDRITDVVSHPVPDASFADALKNEIITRLRSQYLDLAARESIYAAKYGTNHQAVVGIRNQMAAITRNISDEMRKIQQSYKSDYAIAQAREADLGASVRSNVSGTQATNQAQVKLRELVSNAQSYRTLYDNFLQRYADAVQQQSFPTTEARIISAAQPSGLRIKPRGTAAIGAALAGGLLLSFGLAFLREMTANVFRSSGQVEDRLQVECIAVLPLVDGVAAQTAPPPAPTKDRAIAMPPGVWRHAVDHPFSVFSEALRSVKIAVDGIAKGQACAVVGITSTLPAEGKSTIAANLAALLSHAGSRVLLIDADLRNPSLSRLLTPDAKAGLVGLIEGQGAIPDLVWTEPNSNLSMLPAGAGTRTPHTAELLGSNRLKAFIEAARAHYDYVVVDLPPLAPVVDTRTTAGFIDGYIYVVEWGGTKRDVVEAVLADAREIQANLIGVVLNKADTRVLGRYERHRGRDYHRKYYSKYGYVT